MWTERRLLDLLELDHPVVQAPMAGASGPELVAAVSEQGALGSFGAASTPPDKLRETIRQIRERTDRPFNINLFSARTEKFDSDARPGQALRATLESFHSEFGLDAVPEPGPMFGPAEQQLDVLLEESVPVISFHFGVDAETVLRAKQHGANILCSATTVAEARLLEQAGVDVIIAQGAEAGGHRGTFDGPWQDALIGTMALVPQIVDAVSVPVIAAGGIMDGRGLVASLALGASGVQIGTAFLACAEAPVAPAWRQRLFEADASNTKVTEALSGKPARGIINRYVRTVEQLDESLLPYPAQYSLSRSLRKRAAEVDDADFMALWAGQGVGLAKGPAEAPDTAIAAAEYLRQLIGDAQTLTGHLNKERIARMNI